MASAQQQGVRFVGAELATCVWQLTPSAQAVVVIKVGTSSLLRSDKHCIHLSQARGARRTVDLRLLLTHGVDTSTLALHSRLASGDTR